MATIRKKGKKWQVAILKKDGFPPTYKSGFYTKQEAKDWAANEEARRQQANYFPEQASQKHTLATTIDRYIAHIPRVKLRLRIFFQTVDQESVKYVA